LMVVESVTFEETVPVRTHRFSAPGPTVEAMRDWFDLLPWTFLACRAWR